MKKMKIKEAYKLAIQDMEATMRKYAYDANYYQIYINSGGKPENAIAVQRKAHENYVKRAEAIKMLEEEMKKV